nr:hypothetical protein GCM10020093_022860 [Planobispora longispora]
MQWEEPGGTAVVEALACGAPVIGLRRGCLPELVEHGRTGLLADGEEELGDNLKRAEEIDPEECRRSAARRFSPRRWPTGTWTSTAGCWIWPPEHGDTSTVRGGPDRANRSRPLPPPPSPCPIPRPDIGR